MSEDRRLSEHLIHDDHWQTVFRRSEQLNQIFREARIFLGDPNRSMIRMRAGAEISPYTNWNQPDVIHTTGFASYHMGGSGEIVVGNYCSIAGNLGVMGERHPLEYMSTSSFHYDSSKSLFAEIIKDFKIPWKRVEPEIPVYGPMPIIEHDVWIGAGVTLARGIQIGTGAVIGTGSIVTRDVEPFTIVAGNPARPIRKRFDDHTIAALMATRWWEYANVFGLCDTREPSRFLPSFYEALNSGILQSAPSEKITRDTIKLRLLVP